MMLKKTVSLAFIKEDPKGPLVLGDKKRYSPTFPPDPSKTKIKNDKKEIDLNLDLSNNENNSIMIFIRML